VSIYVYVFVYVYIHVYTHTNTHTNTRTHTSMLLVLMWSPSAVAEAQPRRARPPLRPTRDMAPDAPPHPSGTPAVNVCNRTGLTPATFAPGGAAGWEPPGGIAEVDRRARLPPNRDAERELADSARPQTHTRAHAHAHPHPHAIAHKPTHARADRHTLTHPHARTRPLPRSVSLNATICTVSATSSAVIVYRPFLHS
jgi:hypothetical protein